MPTVYERVLGERFQSLHPTLRRFLGGASGGRAFGRMRVTRAKGRLRNAIATVLRIPPAGEYDMTLEVSPRGDAQLWVRRFGPHVLTTRQREYRGLLLESSGPASIGFDLVLQEGALLFRPRRAWAFGIRLPLWLAPWIEPENRPMESGGWRVQVRFGVPLLGQVAEYTGIVVAEGDASGAAPLSSDENDGG